MPKYSITDPNTGKTVTVSGERPPTQADAEEIFAKAGLRQPQPQRPVLSRVADFLGLGTTASNLGALGLIGQQGRNVAQEQGQTQAFNQAKALTKQAQALPRGSAEQKQLLDQARAIMQGSEEQAQGFQQGLAQKQMTAGVSEADLQRGQGEFLARRGIGQTAELLSYAIPGGIAGKSATAGQRIGTAALKGATAGSLQGAAAAGREAETPLQALENVLKGGVQGAAAGAIIQGVIETPQAAKQFWNKTAKTLGNKAEDVYMGTLKENLKDDRFYKQFGGEKQVAKEAAAYKLPNTKQGISQYLDDYGPEYNRKVASTIAKPEHKGKEINLDEIKNKALEIVKRDQGSDQTIIDSAKKWLESNSKIYSGKTSLEGANRLRIGLDKTVGGKLAEEINQGPAAMKKALASVLRNEFKSKVPELKPFIRKYQLVSGLAEAMQKEPKLGLAEITGSVVGTSLGNIPGGLIGLLGATALRSPGLKRAVTTPIIREAARNVPNVVRSAINASPVINPGVAALQRMINRERESKQQNKMLP